MYADDIMNACVPIKYRLLDVSCPSAYLSSHTHTRARKHTHAHTHAYTRTTLSSSYNGAETFLIAISRVYRTNTLKTSM